MVTRANPKFVKWLNRCVALIFVAVFVCTSRVYAADALQGAKNDVVWHWSSHCRRYARIIYVDVTLSGKAVYHTSLSACPVQRALIKPESEENRLVFHFKEMAQHYFEKPVSGEVEGNIWEAGSERSAILLGISFTSGKEILLNTIFIATMNKEARSQVAPGIVITTSPRWVPAKGVGKGKGGD